MRPWKLVALTTALLVLGGVFHVFNGLFGNPISRALANSAANKYIQANYAQLNLEAKPAVYSLKTGSYSVAVQSKDSVDTHFAISCRPSGRVRGDDYAEAVLGGRNTFDRISDEYRDLVEPLIEAGLQYDIEILIADLNIPEDFILENLPLDMEFDIHQNPLPAYVTLYVASDSLSWEQVAEVATELDSVMRQHNLPVAEYTVVLQLLTEEEKPGESLGAYDFPPELLQSTDLPGALEAHFIAWDAAASK